MKTETKPPHTPTPWVQNGPSIEEKKEPSAVIGRAIFDCYTSQDDCGIGEGEGTANAAFIVKACNAHEKLVNACRKAAASIGGEGGDIDYLLEALALAEGKA